MDKTFAKRQKIVDKHMQALMVDLRENDIPAIGVAGGVVLDGRNGPDSTCHAFMMALPDIVVSDGKAFSATSFAEDVAKTLGRAAKKFAP